MHNQQQHFQTNNIISKFAVIVLSIVLVTGISLVPALQIGVNGQMQQQQQPQQQKQVGLSQVIKQIAQQVSNANPGTNATHVQQILVQLAKLIAQTASKSRPFKKLVRYLHKFLHILLVQYHNRYLILHNSSIW